MKIKNKKRKNNSINKTKGITLVALVVTIVILLILSGITMQLIMTDTGIFAKGKQAKQAQEIGQYYDRLAVAEANDSVETMINVTLNSYIGQLKKDKMVDLDEKNLERIDELNAEVTTKEGYIFHIADKKGDIVYEYIGKEEEMLPKIKEVKVVDKSTNHINIEISIIRLGKGSLSYYYKKDNEPESSYQELKKNTTDLTANYTELQQGVIYNIKVRAENKNGNNEFIISEITGELPNGTIRQKGETVWNDGKASIELETSETKYKLEYKVNNENWIKYTGTIYELKHGDVVYGRLTDGINVSDEATVNIEDGVAPSVTVTKGTVTTKNIQVTASATDGQSGIPTSPIYSFYIKKSTDTNYPTTADYTGANNSYTFDNLTQGAGYDIKVTTKDIANNIGTGILTNVTTETVGGATGGLLSGNVVASTPVWSNGSASITLSTTTGLTVQYKVNSGSWTNGTSVTGLKHNDVVFARLTDGVNYGDDASINIQDGVAPSVTVTKGTVTTKNIQVTASATDGQSGIPTSPIYSFYIKKSTDTNYPTTADYTGANNSYTFDNLTQGAGYDIKVTTKDIANNIGTGILTNVTTETVGGATGGLLSGNVVASTPVWSNGSASITLSTTTGLTVQYKVNSGSWTNGTSVTGLKHNDVVFARLTDGVNYGDDASINIQDGVAPSVTVTKGTVNPNNIQVSVGAADSQSGIPATPSYQYYIKKTTDANYSATANYTGPNISYTFTGLIPSTTYDIKVTVLDNAGNLGTGTLSIATSSAATVGQVWIYTSDTSFTVPETGRYSVEIHGRGGTGGSGKSDTFSGLSANGIVYHSSCGAGGGGGGGSGAIFTISLTYNQSYAITVATLSNGLAKSTFGSYYCNNGINGSDGYAQTAWWSPTATAGTGGTYGTYSPEGRNIASNGNNGSINTSSTSPYSTSASGGYAGSGGDTTTGKGYGDGAAGGAAPNSYGYSGNPGAVIIKYLGK